MKLFNCFLILFFLGRLCYAQDTSIIEKTYVRVVKGGLSTAPDFIVITVNDLNTGKSREICIDITSIFWSLMKEKNQNAIKDFTQYMLSKSKYRVFDFKDTEALERLNFNNYSLENEGEIELLLKSGNLIDSLKNFNRLRTDFANQGDEYSDQSSDVLDAISDSITKIRPITAEEKKMINEIQINIYDSNYNASVYNKQRTISKQGEQLMVNWASKIKRYKGRYFTMRKELNRMYNKFFQNYYDKYGLSFCHVAFKHGIITYIAYITGKVSYGTIVN